MRFGTAGTLRRTGVLHEVPRTSLVELEGVLTDSISQNEKGPLYVAPFHFGGDEEDRTPDLRIANATLSQLSYVPTILKPR